MFYKYSVSKKSIIHNNPLATPGVSACLQFFSSTPDAAINYSKLSNTFIVSFDPAATLNSSILKYFPTLSIAHIELQQKVYPSPICTADGDTAFRPKPRTLFCKKNANKFFNLELSGFKVCCETEF